MDLLGSTDSTGKWKTGAKKQLGYLPNWLNLDKVPADQLICLWLGFQSGFLNSPLPLFFRYKLAIYTASFGSSEYLIEFFLANLAELGESAKNIKHLLEKRFSFSSEELIDLREFLATQNLNENLNESLTKNLQSDQSFANEEMDTAILHASAALYLGLGQSEGLSPELKRILGIKNFEALLFLISHLKALQTWIESHPRLEGGLEKKLAPHLHKLLKNEPTINDWIPGRSLLEPNFSMQSPMHSIPNPQSSGNDALGRLAAIVEFSDDAICSLDLENRIENWNRGAEKLFGYPLPEVLGMNFENF